MRRNDKVRPGGYADRGYVDDEGPEGRQHALWGEDSLHSRGGEEELGWRPTPTSLSDIPWGLVSDEIKKKFVRLRDEWKSERGPVSSATKLILHPAYQKIIGMGPAVVPCLLRELERDPDIWFWALRAITEADPVPPAIRGNVAAMAEAWLEWAREQGYQW